jgi:hypothetical protein
VVERVQILRQHAFGTLGGTKNANSTTATNLLKMSKQVEISEENIVPVTADQLNAEQKAEMENLVEQFQNMYLQTYSRTRQGTLIQKSKVVMPSPGEGASTSAAAHDHTVKTEDTAAPTLQDRIDSAVHSALVNQSGILVNTLTNTVKSILDGSIH